MADFPRRHRDGDYGTTTGQRAAVAHVEAQAAPSAAIDADLRVTLTFHPDRGREGVSVLQALTRDGMYRSQFETGTSNGGLTAHPGGDRWTWESRLFGGAYDETEPVERPKYGALNYRRRATGGSPRFGSSHLRLRAHVLERTTLCYPDSAADPTLIAVPGSGRRLVEAAEVDCRDRLDDYIEAHVHGVVAVPRDVEALVLDPCYAGTLVEKQARDLGCALEWHPGFVLRAETLSAHAEYRGADVVAAGLAVARDGLLDARVLASAHRAGIHDPQILKRVWHCIARFGDRSAPGERP